MKRTLALIFVGLIVLSMSTVVLADPQFTGNDEDVRSITTVKF